MYFGSNCYNGEKVQFDRTKSMKECGRGNLLIHGTSGSGKTQLCQREIKELETLNTPVRIFYFLPDERKEKEASKDPFYSYMNGSSRIDFRLQGYSDINEQYFKINGLIKPSAADPDALTYIYIDDFDWMERDKLEELLYLMMVSDGTRTVFTICTRYLNPEETYNGLYPYLNGIVILGPFIYSSNDIYLLERHLNQEEQSAFCFIQYHTDFKFFGVLCETWKNERKNRLFYTDPRSLPYRDFI